METLLAIGIGVPVLFFFAAVLWMLCAGADRLLSSALDGDKTAIKTLCEVALAIVFIKSLD